MLYNAIINTIIN